MTRNDRKLLKQYRLVLEKAEIIKFESILSNFARETILGEEGYELDMTANLSEDIDCLSVDSEDSEWILLGNVKNQVGSSIQLEIANSIKRLLVHSICR